VCLLIIVGGGGVCCILWLVVIYVDEFNMFFVFVDEMVE